jgi:hypothetical protein
MITTALTGKIGNSLYHLKWHEAGKSECDERILGLLIANHLYSVQSLRQLAMTKPTVTRNNLD